MVDLLVLLLLLAPLVTGGLCRLVGQRARPGLINVIGALTTLGLGLLLVGQIYRSDSQTAWGGILWLDPLSGLILVIVCLVSTGAALYSVSYLSHEVERGSITTDQVGWYFLWYHLFVLAMLGICLVNNLGVTWVLIEATTIVSALLVGFHQTEAALEAAWKYIIICTVGITFALFGLLLLYYAAGQQLGMEAAVFDWSALRPIASRLDPQLLKLAFIFVLIGYGTKAGLAPMHTWLPDAYSQAPAPISAVLSGAFLACALYGILRVQLIVSASTGSAFTSGLLLAFGILSLLVAVPFILVQSHLNRLLAYSSVEHVGLIAIGLGLGGRLALYGSLLHLLSHAITKVVLFFAAGQLAQHYGTRQIGRIRGAVQAMPLTGGALLAAGLAISGTPPFSLFVSEFSIISGSFAQGHWWLGTLILLCVGLIFAGMFYHIAGMTLGNSSLRQPAVQPRASSWLLLGLPVAAILLLGLIVPAPLSAMLMRVAAIFNEVP